MENMLEWVKNRWSKSQLRIYYSSPNKKEKVPCVRVAIWEIEEKSRPLKKGQQKEFSIAKRCHRRMFLEPLIICTDRSSHWSQARRLKVLPPRPIGLWALVEMEREMAILGFISTEMFVLCCVKTLITPHYGSRLWLTVVKNGGNLVLYYLGLDPDSTSE